MLKLIRLCCAIVFVCGPLSLPAFAAKKITIQELSSLLETLHDQKKSDEQISSELKLVEITEELTKPTLDSYTKFNPGPLTLEELTVRQYASQFQPLPKDESKVPSIPAPDPAEQKVILDRMNTYINNVYSHLPNVMFIRATGRFSDAPLSRIQDFRVAAGNGTLMGGPLTNVVGNYIRFHGKVRVEMQNVNGVVKSVDGKPAGPANDPLGLIETGQFGPLLRTIAAESAANGKQTYSHWDRINDIDVAVFDFSVDRKKSHYGVNYCCFPTYDMSGGHIGPAQTMVTWDPFKANMAYHGQFYVEPKTGYVLRLVLYADPKTAEFVHNESTRVEYATQEVDGKPYMLPRTSVTLNTIVITGDGGGQSYTEVHSIIATEYSSFTALTH